jgi:hypothetical protein
MFLEELNYISNCAIARLSINYGEMYSSGNFTITPIPPTVFHYYGKVKYHKSALNDQKLLISRLYVTADAELIKEAFTSPVEIEKKYKYQSYKILTMMMRSPFMTLQHNPKPEKLVTKIRAVLEVLIPVLSIRSKDNLHYVECASEVIHQFLIENPTKLIVRELQKDIFDIFDLPTFFRCTSNTLKYWAKIIDITVSLCKGEKLDDYLS